MTLSLVMLTAANAQPATGYGQGRGYAQGWNQDNRQRAGIENIIPDLTEEQKTALQELRTEHFAKMKDHRNKMGELRARQRTIMSDYDIDENAAQKLIDEKTALINKQMKERVAHRAAVNEILTEEQVLLLQQRHQHRKFAGRRGSYGQKGFHRRGAGQFPGRGMGPCGGTQF